MSGAYKILFAMQYLVAVINFEKDIRRHLSPSKKSIRLYLCICTVLDHTSSTTSDVHTIHKFPMFIAPNVGM